MTQIIAREAPCYGGSVGKICIARGSVEKIGRVRGARWKLANGALASRPPFAILDGATKLGAKTNARR